MLRLSENHLLLEELLNPLGKFPELPNVSVLASFRASEIHACPARNTRNELQAP